MLRAVIKMAAWAAAAWLLFFVPIEGRSWARHMQEVWELPLVQAKRQLLERKMVGIACRLRDALPPAREVAPTGEGRDLGPQPPPQERLTGDDRRALDRLIEGAQAAPPAPGASRHKG